MTEPVAYAQAIHAVVASELERADRLAQAGFFTEAVLRLGRTVEAGLYSVARELGVDLTNRTIKHLANLRESIRGIEVNIMRKRQSDEVRRLCHVSRGLAEAIAYLAEDETLREGILENLPRPNEQLLRELTQLIERRSVKRRLEASKELLRSIQVYRNDAAHASLDGSEREREAQDYEDLVDKVSEFLALLFEIIVSERARRIWMPPK